jgi:hypothetical protein
MKKYPLFTRTILGAAKREGYSALSLAKATGIPPATFNRRLDDPGSWSICEIRTVVILINPNECEKQIIGKEVGIV